MPDEPIQQIVIEQVQDGWRWDAYGEEKWLAGYCGATLAVCVKDLNAFLEAEEEQPE